MSDLYGMQHSPKPHVPACVEQQPEVNQKHVWKPCFSRLQVKVINNDLAKAKSVSGIVIIESDSSRLPYIDVEVVAAGPKAGIDSFAKGDVQYETFEVGDTLRVFEKHVEFHYLDGKTHSEYYQSDRPYLAFIQDKYVIAKRYET